MEQAYQASKFEDDEVQESIRLITKTGRERDGAHGMRCWSKGNATKRRMRADFVDVKVRLMYEINLAKYRSNPSLVEDLLSTLPAPIQGGHSTNWTDASGRRQEWSYWNGAIHARLREEFRIERGDEVGDPEVLADLLEKFREQEEM